MRRATDEIEAARLALLADQDALIAECEALSDHMADVLGWSSRGTYERELARPLDEIMAEAKAAARLNNAFGLTDGDPRGMADAARY